MIMANKEVQFDELINVALLQIGMEEKFYQANLYNGKYVITIKRYLLSPDSPPNQPVREYEITCAGGPSDYHCKSYKYISDSLDDVKKEAVELFGDYAQEDIAKDRAMAAKFEERANLLSEFIENL
jgi:hypothetical protein